MINVKHNQSTNEVMTSINELISGIDSCLEELYKVRDLVLIRDKRLLAVQDLTKKVDKLKSNVNLEAREIEQAEDALDEARQDFESSNQRLFDTFSQAEDVRAQLARSNFVSVTFESFNFSSLFPFQAFKYSNKILQGYIQSIFGQCRHHKHMFGTAWFFFYNTSYGSI